MNQVITTNPNLSPAHYTDGRHRAVTAYLAGLGSENSRQSALSALRMITGIASGRNDVSPFAFPWEAIEVDHVAMIQAALSDRYQSANSINQRMNILRGVLKSCWRCGMIESDRFQRLIDFKPVRGESLPRGRSLESGEVRALFETVARDPRRTTASLRMDAALLAAMVSCGLRRSEVVGLDVKDFDPSTGEIKVLRAKGRKDRIVHARNGCLQALTDWLEARGQEPGPLFCAVDRHGNITGNRLTTHAVYFRMKRLASDAGVSEFSPHDLRRSFAGEMLDAGADIAVIQKIMGHSSIDTTAKYDRRPERAKAKAAELIHTPYVKVPMRG